MSEITKDSPKTYTTKLGTLMYLTLAGYKDGNPIYTYVSIPE